MPQIPAAVNSEVAELNASDEKMSFCWNTLKRLDAQIANTNTKIAALVTLHAIILAVAGRVAELEKSGQGFLHLVVMCTNYASILISVLALLFSLLALLARTNPSVKSRYLFFGGVNTQSEYRVAFAAARPVDLLADISIEIENISLILALKYRRLNAATLCSMLAVPLVAASLVLVTWPSQQVP
jgi:Family of unknown function (DUF5706)